MTPLAAALSSSRLALRMASVAAVASPDAAASRKWRTCVFSSDLTALLRWRRASFCLLRLIWLLMFATRKPRSKSAWGRAYGRLGDVEGYPRSSPVLKPGVNDRLNPEYTGHAGLPRPTYSPVTPSMDSRSRSACPRCRPYSAIMWPYTQRTDSVP